MMRGTVLYSIQIVKDLAVERQVLEDSYSNRRTVWFTKVKRLKNSKKLNKVEPIS